jgi:hypothetical protein
MMVKKTDTLEVRYRQIDTMVMVRYISRGKQHDPMVREKWWNGKNTGL